MSGRRVKALRKHFCKETGRAPYAKEMSWLKAFYESHGTMDFGLRRIAPPMMPVVEQAQLPTGPTKPLTANDTVGNVGE